MAKYKFISKKKKDKIHFFDLAKEDLKNCCVKGTHTEISSNKSITVEGCAGVMDYREDYVKIKLKKGFMIMCGNGFEITFYENETITVAGTLISVEFCV